MDVDIHVIACTHSWLKAAMDYVELAQPHPNYYIDRYVHDRSDDAATINFNTQFGHDMLWATIREHHLFYSVKSTCAAVATTVWEKIT